MIIDYDKENLPSIDSTDGEQPIQRKDTDLWREWGIDDVYLGKEGKNRYVPKVDDYVIVPKTGVKYIVTYVDPVTKIPRFGRPPKGDQVDIDTILASSDQAFVLYYDKSQEPYTLSPDATLMSRVKTATCYRIYRGVIIEDNFIISKVYNNSGEFISHDVPLELAQFSNSDINNLSIKSLPSCRCNNDLDNGEICTIVMFDSSGRVVNITPVEVYETTFIPGAYADQRFITNIYLKSTFLEEVDSTTINFPSNLTIDSLNPIGVVVYSDGTEEEHIVDGKKFDLIGLEELDARFTPKGIAASFAATTPGHKVKLVLTYLMSQGESTTMSTGYNPYIIPKKYELIVTEPSRSYGVKLMAYPRWVSATAGYTLDFYLLNLDRNILYPVSSLVKLAENSRGFDPLAIAVTQHLTYMIDLADVSSVFKTYIHSQPIEVILRAPGNDDVSRSLWEINSDYPSATPLFGTDTKAVLQGDGATISITNGCKTVDEWLEKLYLRTDPLINTNEELEPITPTHFSVNYGNHQITNGVYDNPNVRTIDEFNKLIKYNKTLTLYDNVQIIFYKQTVGNYLTLSVCEIPIRK